MKIEGQLPYINLDETIRSMLRIGTRPLDDYALSRIEDRVNEYRELFGGEEAEEIQRSQLTDIAFITCFEVPRLIAEVRKLRSQLEKSTGGN